MPYKTVRAILLQINNAKQLRQLEINSPQLEGDDAECWIRLVNRDFPVLAKRHNFAPKNPSSWYKIYARYERLEAEQKREAEEKLKAAFAGIKKEREGNVSHIVDFDRRKLPHPPRDGRGIGGPRRPAIGRRGGIGPDEGEMRFTGGTRTKTTTAQSVLRKARREAREISARNRLSTPTGLLSVRQGQIAAAPKGMVEEARIKAQSATRIHAPGASRGGGDEQKRAHELAEREARLRRLKSAGASKGANVVSDSDLEDDEDDDGYGDEDDYDSNDDDGYDVGASSAAGPGTLDADELEDLFDEKSNDNDNYKKPTHYSPTKSAKTAAASTSGMASVTTTPKPYVTRRSGILTNAPGSTRIAAIVTTTAKPAATKQSSSSSSASPPKSASASAPARPKAFSPHREHTSPSKKDSPSASTAAPAVPSSASPELKPQAPALAARKRKPVDVFMKPKPKVQKR